jgi:deazaflavin-dependent oxidoreductase (nitroreductase family)
MARRDSRTTAVCDAWPVARTYRLGRTRRLVNSVLTRLLRAGISADPHLYLLSVSGRRSGRTYTTPVILVENGERFLVAPYGEVGWVRNARAAGRVTLSRGRHHETVGFRQVGPEESAPVLRSYLRRVRVVRPFFDVSPDSPLEAFAAEATRHPVFLIEPI